MPMLWGRKHSRDELLRKCGDMRQIAAAEEFEFTAGNTRGVRAVRLRNAAGLDMTVLAERGMSIYDLSFRGTQLAHLSPAGPVHPAFCSNQGLDWLRTWPVGFLTPCGLTNVGSPCRDNGQHCGLHGRIASIPATDLYMAGEWTDEGDYEISVTGTMRENAVFGVNLVLTRRIYTRLGESQFWIDDTVENQGFEPAPFMFLQHINLGWPLLDEYATLHLPESTTEPRDTAAENGVEECRRFSAPVAGYREQVFYHDCTPDEEGQVQAAVLNRRFDENRGLGVYIQYQKADYPNLVQWKMMREGTYVLGIEPANCRVDGRAAERERGTLQFLQPGEKRTLGMAIGVLSGVRELDSIEQDFQEADGRDEPVV